MIGKLWREHRLAMLVFVAASLVALFFAVRLIIFTVYWSDPARRDAVIEGWQTAGYVAMSWDVPRSVVAEALGLAEGAAPRRSLDDIARAEGVPVETLIGDLERAIADYRASQR